MRLVKLGNRFVNPEAVAWVMPAGAGCEVGTLSGNIFTAFDTTAGQALAALKRGPTPCETCRWCASDCGVCMAHGNTQVAEEA